MTKILLTIFHTESFHQTADNTPKQEKKMFNKIQIFFHTLHLNF